MIIALGARDAVAVVRPGTIIRTSISDPSDNLTGSCIGSPRDCDPPRLANHFTLISICSRPSDGIGEPQEYPITRASETRIPSYIPLTHLGYIIDYSLDTRQTCLTAMWPHIVMSLLSVPSHHVQPCAWYSSRPKSDGSTCEYRHLTSVNLKPYSFANRRQWYVQISASHLIYH